MNLFVTSTGLMYSGAARGVADRGFNHWVSEIYQTKPFGVVFSQAPFSREE
ncbi:hypothetical protein [Geoalkalibacter subterraneus]|uniref:hypothetical protein n=1 Tax=Geoalkalibacter subterraneus TaxID=483547 RepID=UPI00130E08DD|nr:hypothetical protein [Geoalkalibacter subterraneus]